MTIQYTTQYSIQFVRLCYETVTVGDMTAACSSTLPPTQMAMSMVTIATT